MWYRLFHHTSFVMLISGAALFNSACNQSVSAGTNKDLNTGLTTTYRNIKPGETFMVMNEEVIGHTDIPLGENFTIINQNVEGLIIKEGKFSAGCSLLISDTNGNTLLNQPDLFMDKDVFDAAENKQLKCTIYTGAPMKWNEEYMVTVTFWDKYGEGVLTNKVSIKMIDYP